MQIRGWLARKHLLHQEIRLGAGRNASHADTIPLPLLGGSRLRWRWAGSVGAELALSPPSSPHSCCPFLSQCNTDSAYSQAGAEGKGGETVHSGRARGVRKRGSEDVLLIEVAPGLFTGFWESQGGSCCYCCWWNLKVLWCEPCRTGKDMLGKQLPPGMLPLAVSHSHKPLPSSALTGLLSRDHLTNGVWRSGELPQDWGCQIHDFLPS